MKTPRWLAGALVVLACAWAASAAHATVVVIAPHPDDGEASCGGLIANTVAAGESVVVLEMTGGELAVYQKTHDEARAIRLEESRRAAAVLGARSEAFGAIDGSLAVDAASAARLAGILLRLRPRLVVAPWPLDVHSDHQAAGLLAWRTFLDRRFDFELYFYETSNSPHTMTFQFVPTDYVNITGVLEKKREATYQHATQGPADWFGMYVDMARFRGYECDVTYAEAYVRARTSSGMGGRANHVAKTLGTGR
jgi:LmbE family N-acetylglucosaminyl deacetylase